MSASTVVAAPPQAKNSEAKDAEPMYDILDLATADDPNALEVKVGPHGYVRLLDCMPRLIRKGTIGVESAIVEAARVSYGPGTKSVSTDIGLLKYLIRNEHMSPFEMVEFRFIVCCEIFTARQWFRHRTWSYNEESARYSEIEDQYYAPTADEVRQQSATNKQGSSDAPTLCAATKESFSAGVNKVVKIADEEYRRALHNGVAREQARVVLPVGTYTRFHAKVDARNLLHFLELRMDSHAQKEIRDYATAIYTILCGVTPHLMSIFDIYVRGSVRLSALEIRALRTGAIPPEMSATEAREWEIKRAKLLIATEPSAATTTKPPASSSVQ